MRVQAGKSVRYVESSKQERNISKGKKLLRDSKGIPMLTIGNETWALFVGYKSRARRAKMSYLRNGFSGYLEGLMKKLTRSGEV